MNYSVLFDRRTEGETLDLIATLRDRPKGILRKGGLASFLRCVALGSGSQIGEPRLRILRILVPLSGTTNHHLRTCSRSAGLIA